MAEKKFYLESASSLQEIGLRPQIISFLISNGIGEGNAINDMDNQKKVIVAVRLADERKIKEVKEQLVKHLNNLHKNDFCYSNFPQDIQATELMELSNPHTVMILPLNDLANSLMLEQTSKGVGAMLHLSNTLKPLHDLPKILQKLMEKLDKL